MITATKQEYLMLLRKQYFKANKAEKSSILNEICRNLRCHRKSAVRAINRPPEPKRKPETPRVPTHLVYSSKVLWIIEHLWRLTEYPCGLILKACIPLWLPFLKKFFPIDDATQQKLLQISASTIDCRIREKKKTWQNSPLPNPHSHRLL